MSYHTTLNRLYQRAPQGIILGLDRIRAAASALGNPHLAVPCIQVAGTNGKGTVCAIVASAAQAAGLKVGLFTSPHLHRFAERIRVNGQEASEAELGFHLHRVLALCGPPLSIPLTFFEVTTLTAFCVFADRGVDLAVLEVGLGGRLDATSIASPFATAITSIGLDHTDLLGHTIPEIAGEKAAIARPGVPMVVGALVPKAMRRVAETATQQGGGPLFALGRDFFIREDLPTPRPGIYWQQNVAVSIKLFEIIGEKYEQCTEKAFLTALEQVGLPGRFEIIGRDPSFILDGAHNMEAVEALVATLETCQITPDLMIFGALKGKPIDAMLATLRPRVGRVMLFPPPISRACDPRSFACDGDQIVADAAAAITAADAGITSRGTVLITGSLFAVAAIRGLCLGEKTDPPIGL